MAAPKNQQDGKLQQKILILSFSLSVSHVQVSVVDFFLTFFFLGCGKRNWDISFDRS